MNLTITVYLADGRQITMPFWYLEGYRIASKKTHYKSTAPTNICMAENPYATFWWVTYRTPDPNDGGWHVLSCLLEDDQYSYFATNSLTVTNSITDNWQYGSGTNLVAVPSVATMTNWNLRGVAYCSSWGSSSPPGSHDASYLPPWWVDVSLQFGTNNSVTTTTYSYPLGCGDVSSDVFVEQNWRGDIGEMVVNWPLHYPAGKKVLLTIEGLEYTRIAGEAFNGSNVTMQVGETTYTPLVITNAACGYGYDLSYWVTVSGSNFTLGGTTFTWPTSTSSTNYVGESGNCSSTSVTGQENYHHLSFRGFHNGAPNIMWVNDPSGTASDIADRTYRGSVGQRFTLQFVPPANAAGKIASYSWSVPNNAITNCNVQYDSTNTCATQADPPDQLTVTDQPKIDFVWANGGVGLVVTCKATLKDGGSITASTTFNINRPDNVSVSTFTDYVYFDTRNFTDGSWWLHFGSGVYTPVGIKFITSSVKDILKWGQFEWVQIVNGKYWQHLHSGDWRHAITSGLDRYYPYPNGYCTADNVCAVDSPGLQCPSNYDEIQADTSFQMWLMFRPNPDRYPGALWVPLKRVDWSWKGAAHRIGLLCGQLDFSDWQPNPPAVNTT